MTAHHAALLEIPLVILLSSPEGRPRNHLRCNLLTVCPACAQLRNLCAGLSELLVAVGKDNAAILRAVIRTLAIHLGRIVHRKESVQQRFVGKTGWIEG